MNYQEEQKERRQRFDKYLKDLSASAQKLREHNAREAVYEIALENYMMQTVHFIGGLALKLNPTGAAGLPDLLVLYQGSAFMVELKTEKGVVREHQKIKHALLKLHGFPVEIVRGKTGIDDFIELLKLL